MIISQANSIRFKKVNSDLPGFDNTLLADEKFYNDLIETYCQRWKSTDTETVIIKSDSAVIPTVIATLEDKTTVIITAAPISSYDTEGLGTDLYFYSFDVVFSLYALKTSITVTQGGDEYISEPIIGNLTADELNGEYLKIEYSNVDNAFQLDFSTEITFSLYLPSILKDYQFGGDSSTYDNQDELTKLKETVQRLLVLKSIDIPRYLAETMKLASSMDNFTVNDIAFVRAEQPEIIVNDGMNLVEISMTLTDSVYLGVNTHDIGYDCDEATTTNEIMNLTENNASGSVTFVVTAGYLLHTLRAEWVSGTAIIKLGTTLAGDDLAKEFTVSSVVTNSTVAIHSDLDRDSDANVYLTVTGGVVNIDIQLIRNIE